MKKIIIALFSLLLVATCAVADYGNHYTLELVHPKAGLDAGHRIYKAYTGIEYNIRAAAIGGKYPYTYTLSNAPSGMTINGSTGTISWENPQSTASSIVVRVTDQDGDYVEGTWSVAVGTSGFVFVDDDGNDSTGDGSISSPYQTFGAALSNASTADFVYFRAGTYSPNSSGDNFISSSTAAVFIGYPGETAIFDLDTNDDDTHNPRIGVNRDSVWFDNLTIRDAYEQMFYLNGSADNMTFRRLTLSDVDYGSSSNESFFRVEYAATGGLHFILQDCTLTDTEDDPGNVHDVKGMSLYSFRKMLIEDNAFSDIAHTMIDVKEGLQQYTIRHNTFSNWGLSKAGNAFAGVTNDDRNTGTDCDGEILFNYVRKQTNSATGISDGDAAGMFIPDGDMIVIGPTYIERNTLYGTPFIFNIATTAGPFYFSDNLIINNNTASDGDQSDGIYNRDGTDDSRIVRAGSVVATTADDPIVIETGETKGDYVQYVGSVGWETQEQGSSSLTSGSGATNCWSGSGGSVGFSQ